MGKGGTGKGKGKSVSKQKVPDYSGLKKGLKLQVKADDDQFYAAEVVDVSQSTKRSKAPVRIHWVGYTSASDEWVAAERIRSKALKFVTPTKAAKPYTAEEKEFLQANYPKNLEDVKTDWLSKVLRTKVTAMSVKKKLEAGVTADAAIFNLAYNNSYHPSGKGPGSIVLKYAKSVEQSREIAVSGQMYEKEVMLFSTLHQRIGKCLPIPQVIGTFVDVEKPQEFFCIAMEDLSIDFNPMDQIVGFDMEDAMALAPIVAGLHAEFWEDELLKHPVICNGNEKKCNVWFETWYDTTMENLHAIDILYKFMLTSPKLKGFTCDMFPTADDKKMIQLLKKHGKAIQTEFHRILDSRPKTLVHGDMRSDNLFKRKPELGKGFKFIDWQTFAAAAPGIEMIQLISGSFGKLEDLDNIDGVMEVYLKTLHSKCPASKSYTMEMLKEDLTIAFTMFFPGNSAIFAPLVEALPAEHPLWDLFGTVMPRYNKMAKVIKRAEYVIKLCERLGLEVDPGVPFLDAEKPDENHSKAWNLWHKAGKAVLNELRFAGLYDKMEFGALRLRTDSAAAVGF